MKELPGGTFTAFLPATQNYGRVPDSLDVRPTWFKVTDRGGSYRADFKVEGAEQALWNVLEWMGREIRINDEYGTDVWRGKITEIDLKIAGMNISLSYSAMYNKIKVLYSYESPDGTNQATVTDWAEDTMSTGQHGERELIYSLSDIYQVEAEAKRDRLLEEFKNPVGVPTMAAMGTGATISAQGFYHFNDWKYYERIEGRVEWPYSPTRDIMVGYKATGTGFNFHFGKLHDFDARIKDVIQNNFIHISGTGGGGVNDGVWLVTSDPSDTQARSITSTQISFDQADDVRLVQGVTPNFGTAGFRPEEIVRITGSTGGINDGNDGVWAMENVTTDWYFDITEGFNGGRTIITDGAGPSITIDQGISVQLNEGTGTTSRLADADNLTITGLGYGIAQGFTAPGTWEAQRIALTAYRVGSPTDDLIVRIYPESNGFLDASGGALATAQVDGADLATVRGQVWIDFPTALTLTSGTRYWIHVSRTGSLSDTDFFVVGVTDDNILAPSSFRLATENDWYAYEMSLSFMLYSTEDTKEQIEKVLAETDQFGGNLIWDFTETGVRTHPYQDGRARASTILDELLEEGGPNGRRLILLDDEDGNYYIREEPDIVSSSRYPLIWADGRVTRFTGGPIPRGQLPVGEWVAIAELPTFFSSVAGELSPLYVMEAELDVESGGTPTLRPRQIATGDRIERA